MPVCDRRVKCLPWGNVQSVLFFVTKAWYNKSQMQRAGRQNIGSLP